MLAILLPGQRRRTCIEERTVYGLPVLTLTVPVPHSDWEERLLGRALERWHRAGAGEVLLGDFPIGVETLAAHGLRPVDPGPLRCAALPQLLAWMAGMHHITLQRTCVALSAPQTTKTVCDAAELLCASARYIALRTGLGQEALEDRLRRRWGIAPGGTPRLEVSFTAVPCTGAPALLVGEGCTRQTIRWRTGLDQPIPEELAAVLFAAKKCQIADFHPEWVEMRT